MLNTVRYDDGKLDVEMRLNGANALDMLRQRVAETGLSLQVTDSQAAGSALTLQLRISAGGAR